MAAVCKYLFNPLHDDYYSTSSVTSVWLTLDQTQDEYEPLTSVLEGVDSISVYSFKYNVDTCQFNENYSGLKGTAAYYY